MPKTLRRRASPSKTKSEGEIHRRSSSSKTKKVRTKAKAPINPLLAGIDPARFSATGQALLAQALNAPPQVRANAVPRLSDIARSVGGGSRSRSPRFAAEDPRNHMVVQMANVARQHLDKHNANVARQEALNPPIRHSAPLGPPIPTGMTELARQKKRDARKQAAKRVTGRPSVSAARGSVKPKTSLAPSSGKRYTSGVTRRGGRTTAR
jgi:hypothetical protein